MAYTAVEFYLILKNVFAMLVEKINKYSFTRFAGKNCGSASIPPITD